MLKPTRFLPWSFLSILAALLIVAGAPKSTAQTPAAAPAKPADAAKATIRINAGAAAAVTDADGNTWLADQGFDGGDVVERDSDLKIANTKNPVIYRTEHYGMNGFSYKLPNGKYVVKLHFAETFEGIDGAGQRVFSFTVEGHDFKDFDVFVKAGGALHAYVETVNVEVTDGKLDITFTSKLDNPEINAIEIAPAS
jgi:endoglucanase